MLIRAGRSADNTPMRIGSRPIGPGHPVYIIAELGVNHDGSPQRALDLTDAAADAGADAVKLQFFRADLLMSRACRLAAYQRDAGESDPLAMLRRLELPLDAMAAVIDRAHTRGMHAIVTVFSDTLVPEARQLPWDAYKTASPDLVNLPLLEALADTGAPLILSTGAATADEVRASLSWFSPSVRDEHLALLQCVSSYPAAPENASLGGMVELAAMHDGPIGYSDHTDAHDTGALAAGLGACILEKHLTYDRSAPGPDHRASLDPAGFAHYAVKVRQTAPRAGDLRRHRMSLKFMRGDLGADPRLGPPQKRLLDCELDVRSVSRQSLVAARDLPAGHTLTRADLAIKRPGTGLEPFRIREILGRPLARAVAADTPLTAADVALQAAA